MSKFVCPVARVESLVPLGDMLAIARVDGLNIIVPRAEWHVGNLGAVIPVGAVLPPNLALSLKGKVKLFGERRDRTRPFKLLDQISEGLLLGPLPHATEGDDAAPWLGIKKYEPMPPPHMRGDCVCVAGMTIPYDIESYRRHRKILLVGEEVEITEKIHGTFCAVSIVPSLSNPSLVNGDTIIYSKGLAEQGLSFSDTPRNANNVYVSTIKRLAIREEIIKVFGYTSVTVFGEVFGPTIQDLTYGQASPVFNVFDVWIGSPEEGRFADRETLALIDGFSRVPALYRGPFDKEKMVDLANGETVAGLGSHIREGVIVTPLRERRHPRIGRVILKYVSNTYLIRKRATEWQ